MKAKQLKNISIRGRMAFAICCFENAIDYFSYNRAEWKLLIDRFWKYVSMPFLDDWHMEACEFQAEAILEEVNFDKKGIQYLTKEEYLILRRLYKSFDKAICEISNRIFYLGTVDLYGALAGFSQNTLKELQAIIDIMELNKIPLPEIKFFEKFRFDEGDGWGNMFTRDDVFAPILSIER